MHSGIARGPRPASCSARESRWTHPRAGLRVVLLTLASAGSIWAQGSPPVPSAYTRFFYHYTDRRSLLEKALNSIGLSKLAVPRSFALIAGVTRYPNFPPLERDLRPAAIDLDNLKRYLRDQEFFDEIVVLQDGDMTLDNLNYFLGHYFPEHMAGFPHSRFLFAYSGHGYAVGTGRTARGFLLRSSAADTTDTLNSVDLTILRAYFAAIVDSAEQVLVLINACNSGAFVARVPFGGPAVELGAKGAHAIVASRTSQRSFHDASLGPGSIFFEKVLAGLGGLADRSPPDGVVTYHELDTYLHGEIPLATNGAQTPMEGDISRDGSEGDFYFLNRSRQVRAGNVPQWNPASVTAFGAQADGLEERALAAFRAGQYAAAAESYREAAGAGSAVAMHYLGWIHQSGLGVPQDFTQAREWYEKGAAAGSADSMNNLGWLYENGRGVPQDYAQARQWYKMGADAGSAAAMMSLGWLYGNGYGVPQDFAQARQWYEKGAAAGSARSIYEVGDLYFYGRGVPRDYAQARQWYEKGAAAGSAEAMYSLGVLYRDGLGVARDYAQARQWHEKGAAAGSAYSMYELGVHYQNGRGVEQDYAQARQWYEKGAAAGGADSMYGLGDLFYYGRGVPRDYAQARQWYEKGAAAGSAYAMYSLGVLYRDGLGVARDYAQARQWHEKGAAAGSAHSMYELGDLYYYGRGVPQDYAQARQWYEKGAAAGSASAMYSLGVLYRDGLGVTRDYAQARQWYEKGAAAGSAYSMYELGVLYQNGRGVARDNAQARQWYEKGAAGGSADAKKALEEMPR
jgi:uncharacterized protein